MSDTKAIPQIDPTAHPGALICMPIPDDLREHLRDLVDDVDDDLASEADLDHITIAIPVAEADELQRCKGAIVRELAAIAQRGPAIVAELGGVARFTASDASDGLDPLVVLVDSHDLVELYAAIDMALDECGIELDQRHGFTPHITIGYLESDEPTPAIRLDREPIVLDSLAIIWAGERLDLPFTGNPGADYDDDELVEPSPELKALPPAELPDGDDQVDELDQLAIAPGQALKAIGDYRIAVRGIVYGGRDLVGDEFDRETDLGFGRSPIGMPVYYDHAQRGIKSQIGTVTAWKADDAGIDFEVELDRRNRYADKVMALANRGALGGSTGALTHLVHRAGGTLKRWIVGELSLTPTPAEPRTVAAVKSAAGLHLVEREITLDALKGLLELQALDWHLRDVLRRSTQRTTP